MYLANLFCLLTLVACSILPKGLQHLTLSTWDTSHVTGSPPSLVSFVRPSDPSYPALHSIFSKLGDDLKNVRVIEVNCEEEADLCRNFQVRRYPYIAYFTEDTNTTGVEAARPYLGKRTEEGLRQFLKKITTPAINEMESAPTVDIMVDEITAGGERTVFLMVQPPLPPHVPNTTRVEGPKCPLVEAFRLTANRLRDRYGFANIRQNQLGDVGGLEDVLPPLPPGVNPNTTFVARLGIGEGRLAPMLLGIDGAKSLPYAFRSMAGLAKERRRWDGGGGGGGPLPDPSKDPIQAGLLAWVHRWRHPLITNLPRNITELAANPEGRALAIAVLAGDGEEGGGEKNADFMAAMENLADTWHESELYEEVFDKLFFCKLKNAPSHASFFNLYNLLPEGKALGDISLPALLLVDETNPVLRRVQWAGEGIKEEKDMAEWFNAQMSSDALEAKISADGQASV